MLAALRALYSNYSCGVRVNGFMTDWFPSESGVKQGCLLSPLLFDLYVDTMVHDMASTNVGIQYGGRLINVLLYADDVVLIAENASDLQILLDKLDAWFQKWRLELNEDKTSVVVFRNNSVLLPEVHFHCGNKPVSITPNYKYLGLTLNEHLNWDLTVKTLAASAQRALGVVIAKHKRFGGMPYKAYKAAYESMVRPILEYASEIWGHKDYASINNVFLRAERAYLGVGKYTPNNAVVGDIGWTPPVVRQKASLVRWWCKMVRMDVSRLTRCAFDANVYHAENGRNNWALRTKKILKDIELHNIYEYDNVFQYSIKWYFKTAERRLFDLYEANWYNMLHNDNRPNPLCKNKLRVYRTFKHSIRAEEYVTKYMCSQDRRCFAQFRCGVAPLRCETDRYNRGNYIPYEQRICNMCNLNTVENEFHVFCVCPVYSDIRKCLYEEVQNVYPHFMNADFEDKFIMLFNRGDVCKITARAASEILKHRRYYAETFKSVK
jgi:hypothetical protein